MEVSPGVFDFRLENDSSMIVSGPSKSGKSTFVMALIKHKDTMFREPIRRIWWFYGISSPFHQSLKDLNVELKEGVPTVDDFSTIGRQDLVVLDDMQTETGKNDNVTNMFLKGLLLDCTVQYWTQHLP